MVQGGLSPTVVIGLGNPLRGDDGVGVRAVQMLASRPLPPDVELIDGGTQGLGIVTLFEGRQQAILIDAADVGQPPGRFVRFTMTEAELLGDDQKLSIHAAGVRDALLLAQALQILPEIVIFGVQPAYLGWERGLSPEVEAALPALVTAVMAELVDNG